MNAKIFLVTGGAGFIGSNFIRYFLTRHSDTKIINFDSLTYAGNLRNLDSVSNHPNYTFFKGSIDVVKDVKDVFETFRPTHVVNFAAESHVDRSIMDSGAFLRTNVMGTQNLLDASRQYQVRKFIQISTDEVYGSLGAEGKFTESSNLLPNSPYSASKASADMFVRAAHKTYGLNVCITRCSNNYGENQFPEKLIPLMINNALHDKELPVYGDGLNVRDWIHVEDHCRAIDLVIEKGESGGIYNVGSDNEWANINIIKLLLKKLNKPESLITYVKDRPGHDRRYAIDSSKIQRELGWTPHIRFEEGIQRTIDWYVQHKDWTEDIVSGEYMNYYKTMYEGR